MKFFHSLFSIPLILSNLTAFAFDDYKLGTNSMFNPDVPQGEVTKHRWENSKIFPGTVRDYWVYVPNQYDAAKAACVMVFQDGEG